MEYKWGLVCIKEQGNFLRLWKPYKGSRDFNRLEMKNGRALFEGRASIEK